MSIDHLPPPSGGNGFFVNSKNVAMMVGLLALVSAAFTVFDRINSYEYRINQIEKTEIIRDSEIKALTGELKLLTTKLTDLTIELKEMRAEYNSFFGNRTGTPHFKP